MNYHVYALLRKGEHRPFYLGATSNVQARTAGHRNFYGQDFTLVVMETVDTVEEASRLESELIVWYQGRGVKLENRRSYPSYFGPKERPEEPESPDEQKARKCREAFARAVADGSAARIAAEYLASRT